MLAVIVDDNKQAALDLAERLREFEDVEVGGMAINGMDGLSLVSQVQPDVLFLDVQLPDLSGLDFLEKMSSHTHGKCRVVMYTAYDEYILPAFRKKAFDVLLKPIMRRIWLLSCTVSPMKMSSYSIRMRVISGSRILSSCSIPTPWISN